ncbi:MAG: hypothetical protein NC246_16075 [Muribaculaceae bacterium]|nr:hypothetical protein [Muribaculaceae bacterium]
MLGCTKTDLSRWENNPCSTHLTSRNAKKEVVKRAEQLFDLSVEETESLANKAGLSLCGENYRLEEMLKDNGYRGKRSDFLQKAGISERMFQYYMTGRTPTKQALLAMAVAGGLPTDQIDRLLASYGYCLSKSLANDMVVLWFLKHSRKDTGGILLEAINCVLDDLELPLLMTKPVDR